MVTGQLRLGHEEDIAALGRKLEENAVTTEHIPQSSVMSLFRNLNGENLIFEEVSFQLLDHMLQITGNNKRADVILYVYTELSIKASEKTMDLTEGFASQISCHDTKSSIGDIFCYVERVKTAHPVRCKN